MTDHFNEFWRLFPRKVAKLEALKAWKQMTREYSQDDIISGLERNLSSLLTKEKRFIKHPASWLRAGCWMDEPEPAQSNTLMSAAQAVRERLEFNRDAGRTDQSPSSHYDHAQQLPSTEWH